MTISAFRTVKWAPPVPGFVLNADLQWPPKRPLDVEDFSLDISAWLADAGDSISSVQIGTTVAGITVAVAGSGFVGAICSASISAGAVGAEYPVDFVVTTASGRVVDFIVMLAVIDGPLVAPNPTPPPQLTYSFLAAIF